MADRVHVAVSVSPISRAGGTGLRTSNRFNDFELYRPPRRPGLAL